MRVMIGSTCSENIEKKYFELSKEVLDFLATNDCDLNWGCGSYSLMGLSYDVFKNHNRKIFGFTSPKYTDDLKNLQYATYEIYDTTFDLKKNSFESSDFILMLPGGIGTISEFFAYLEEIRSNDKNTPLILYNVDGHFDSVVTLIDDLIARGFNKENVKDFFMVANNLEEFKIIFDKIKKK